MLLCLFLSCLTGASLAIPVSYDQGSHVVRRVRQGPGNPIGTRIGNLLSLRDREPPTDFEYKFPTDSLGGSAAGDANAPGALTGAAAGGVTGAAGGVTGTAGGVTGTGTAGGVTGTAGGVTGATGGLPGTAGGTGGAAGGINNFGGAGGIQNHYYRLVGRPSYYYPPAPVKQYSRNHPYYKYVGSSFPVATGFGGANSAGTGFTSTGTAVGATGTTATGTTAAGAGTVAGAPGTVAGAPGTVAGTTGTTANGATATGAQNLNPLGLPGYDINNVFGIHENLRSNLIGITTG